MMMPPLLIPWTLRPGTLLLVGLVDPFERAQAHLEGLLAWLAVPELEQIVVAKNCDLPVNASVLRDLADDHGKQLEFLQVRNARDVVFRGKGFGEGALVHEALAHSRLLSSADSFFKVTGKLFAPNYAELLCSEGHAGFYESVRTTQPRVLLPSGFFRSAHRVNFLIALRKKISIPWNCVAYSNRRQLDTRIYWLRREFYRNHLQNAHLRVCEPLGYNLEDAMYQDVEALGRKKRLKRLEHPPVIYGRSGTLGTSGAAFSEEIQARAREAARALLQIDS